MIDFLIAIGLLILPFAVHFLSTPKKVSQTLRTNVQPRNILSGRYMSYKDKPVLWYGKGELWTS